jgi:hypothetical protein
VNRTAGDGDASVAIEEKRLKEISGIHDMGQLDLTQLTTRGTQRNRTQFCLKLWILLGAVESLPANDLIQICCDDVKNY